MQLDFNLLIALDALLDEESVTGAADRLRLSPPAMSRTLGRIRRATGDQILVRTGRFMTPTPRALAIREEVRSLVQRTAEVLGPEQDLDLGALERIFTIQGHDALITALAPVLVERMLDVAPRLSVRFLSESTSESVDIRRGLVDLGIGSSLPTVPDVVHCAVAADELVGVARTGHPILQGLTSAGMDIEAWASVPHVVVSRRGRLRDAADDALGRVGLSRTVAASTASTGAAIEIVRATDAIVVVPTSVARRMGSGFTAFALPLDLSPAPVVLTWHRHFTADSGHQWLRTVVSEILEAGVGAPLTASGIGRGARTESRTAV